MASHFLRILLIFHFERNCMIIRRSLRGNLRWVI
ncbi:hypothetical protein WN944_003645 [Citrus x changshan-huyou]|uniref:Uncharacterized protein n=1 Tax=Citrus x changshan-huyou TaxID=2935761 RepID=A0AAP0M1Z9_9ROSI